MDEAKEAAIKADDAVEEYEAVVKITVMATSPEEAQEKIEAMLESNIEDELITEFEFVSEEDGQ